MKGKIMEILREMESFDDPGKLGEETKINLEEVVEKETGLTSEELKEKELEKLAKKELEEAGPYINGLVDKLKKEIEQENKKEYGDDYSLSDISCENLNEILIDKIINEITPKQLDDCSKNGITLKNVSEHFLIEETLGILAISASGKHCGQIILAYGHAGMPEKGEGISRKIIDNLKPEEREIAESNAEIGRALLIHYDDTAVEKQKKRRKFIEDILGKTLNELDEEEIKKFEQVEIPDSEFFNDDVLKDIKKTVKDMEKIWKRFGGGNLSEAEEEHKRKKRVIGKWEKIDKDKEKKESKKAIK